MLASSSLYMLSGLRFCGISGRTIFDRLSATDWYARILLFSMDFFVDNVVTIFPPFQPTIGRSEVWFVHLCGQMFRFFCEYWSGNWYVLLSGILNHSTRAFSTSTSLPVRTRLRREFALDSME